MTLSPPSRPASRVEGPAVRPQSLARMLDRALKTLPLPAPSLEFDALVEQGARSSGCAPSPDESYAEPLRVLLESARTASLNDLGRSMLAMAITLRLRNHFAIRDFLDQHPEVADEPIVAPVFVVALPRTGTTMLHRLLSVLPEFRAPRIWEMDRPPPLRPTAGALPPSWTSAARIRLLHWLCPDLRRTHDVYADAPEECIHLLANELVSPNFTYFYDLPGYLDFLHQVDLESAYRGHRRQLQLLQAGQPRRRWVLKAPFHLTGLDALLRVYPDASIVMTHRDPARIVPSVSSLMLSLRRSFHEQVDPVALGAEQLETFGQSLDRALRTREQHGDDAFLDIRYEDLVTDPVRTADALTTRLGVPLGTETVAELKRHLTSHHQHRYGKHRYSLEQFGLAPDEVRERFAAYSDRFVAD